MYNFVKFLILLVLPQRVNSLVCPVFIKSYIEQVNNVNNLVPNIEHFKPSFECGAHIVKMSTGLLPDFDKISHIVLTANEQIINKILDSSLSEDIKKKLILQVVEITREGDEMGSVILANYYKLIDFLL
tara:strand:- start:865 stop:1251 length:387 start_codon:yes stop_codon:yes gene_type:complete